MIKQVFTNVSRSLPIYLRKCSILKNRGLNNFMSTDELFAKLLQSLKTCLSANNNFSVKLVLSLESSTIFYERSKITSVPILVLDFSFVSFE